MPWSWPLSWRRWAVLAALLYPALLVIGFAGEWQRRSSGRPASYSNSQNDQGEAFAISRKNYATAKQAVSGQPIGNGQKYEKIASLTQRSTLFDADRLHVDAVIAAHQGIVQLERGTGLTGHRVLHLGVGVPPDKFDAFIATVRDIGKTVLITTIKNDKTNEYLQLRAKRASLEKARAALDALQGSGGSIDERIHVQSQLTGIEEKIQELGVSLGDFDSQNELCTVKLTLEEASPPAKASFWRILVAALSWATLVYAGIGAGFAALMTGAWVGVALFAKVRQLMAGRA